MMELLVAVVLAGMNASASQPVNPVWDWLLEQQQRRLLARELTELYRHDPANALTAEQIQDAVESYFAKPQPGWPVRLIK
jgi:hypothetical protein